MTPGQFIKIVNVLHTGSVFEVFFLRDCRAFATQWRASGGLRGWAPSPSSSGWACSNSCDRCPRVHVHFLSYQCLCIAERSWNDIIDTNICCNVQIVSDLSLKDFPMPNVQEFLQMDAFELNTKSVPLPKIGDIRLPRNQWYFHHANDAHDTAGGDQSAESSASATRDTAHVTASGGSGGGAAVSWRTIVVFFVVIDALWLVSRLARAYATARLILYGTPVFIDADSTAGRRFCVTSATLVSLSLLNVKIGAVVSRSFLCMMLVTMTSPTIDVHSVGDTRRQTSECRRLLHELKEFNFRVGSTGNDKIDSIHCTFWKGALIVRPCSCTNAMQTVILCKWFVACDDRLSLVMTVCRL